MAHPENALKGHHPKGIGIKWDWEKVLVLAQEHHWGGDLIARELDMPVTTVSHILHALRRSGRLPPSQRRKLPANTVGGKLVVADTEIERLKAERENRGP